MQLICALLAVGAVLAHTASVDDFHVVYEWYKLDFTWKNDQAKLEAYVKNLYDARSNVIQNVKVWKDLAFLTLPRSKKGVPATLVYVSSAPKGHSASPHLTPFPSWELQEVGNCEALQNVQAIEIDPDGLLWVADSGVVEEFTDFSEPVTKCPPKLLVFDIETEKLVSELVFDRKDVQPKSRLTDIVIDPSSKTAYISAVSDTSSAIFVYNNASKSLKRVGLPAVVATSVTVNGSEVPLALNKVSLAFSPSQRLLYLAPSWEAVLYSVNVDALQPSAVQPVGRLPGLSYAIASDADHCLYFSVLESDSIAKWDTTTSFDGGLKIIARDETLLQFPTSFSFDRAKNLWVVSNRFQTYLSNSVNLEVPNFRLVRAFVGSESYMFAPLNNASSLISHWSVILMLLFIVLR